MHGKTLSIAGIGDHEVVKEFRRVAKVRGLKIWFAALEAFALWLKQEHLKDTD